MYYIFKSCFFSFVVALGIAINISMYNNRVHMKSNLILIGYKSFPPIHFNFFPLLYGIIGILISRLYIMCLLMFIHNFGFVGLTFNQIGKTNFLQNTFISLLYLLVWLSLRAYFICSYNSTNCQVSFCFISIS